MHTLESSLESVVRVYTKNSNINAVPGDGFKTDGDRVYYVPIPDEVNGNKVGDETLTMTRVGFKHEMGHCLHTDFNRVKQQGFNRTGHFIWNVLEDVRIERLNEKKWPGHKRERLELFKTFIPNRINKEFDDPQVSMLQKIGKLLYLRATEKRIGDLGLQPPAPLQKLLDEKCGDLMDRIATTESGDEIIDLAKEIYKRFGDMTPPKPKPQPQSKDDKPQESDEGEPSDSEDISDEQSGQLEDGEDESDTEQSGSGEDEEGQEGAGSGEDSEDDGEEKDGKGTGSGDDSEDDEDEEGQEGAGSGDEGEEGTSSEDCEDGEDAGSENNTAEKEDGGTGGSDSGDSKEDDLKDERKELAEDVEQDQDGDSVVDDIENEVEKFAGENHIYRDAAGLQDEIYRVDGSVSLVKMYEQDGKKLAGTLSQLFRRLFISSRAPKTRRHQKDGRLDLRKLWNDNSETVFTRTMKGTDEDSAVSLIIDNSSSMINNNKSYIASSMLAYLASELDKLRIPFEACGFTTIGISGRCPLDRGVRTTPILINQIKKFNEPYRSVRGNFEFPQRKHGTVELPCVKFAAERLLKRKESKKILFILSDGQTGAHDMLPALQQYIKDLIEKKNVKVIGFGINSNGIQQYCPHSVQVTPQGLSKEVYKELIDVLVKGA